MGWFFGEYLQRLLDEKEWTASKLARKSKLSHVYMGHLLRDDRTPADKHPRISVDTMTALSNALEVPVSKLLLAYKGIDPDTVTHYQQDGFNIYAEIYAAAENFGVDLHEIDPEARYQLETSVIRLLRRLLDPVVGEELSRLKLRPSPDRED